MLMVRIGYPRNRNLETVSKIPLEDLAADPRQLQIVESSMDRRQSFVTDLQSPCLSDPRQRPLHHPADLAQPTPVRRTRPRQVVLDPSPLEPLLVARGPVLPVAIQSVRPTPSASARLPDRRNSVEQRHRQERLVPLGTRDLHRQGSAVPVYEEVAF
jgi:hypothetical protein